jgi:hypothetical protein
MKYPRRSTIFLRGEIKSPSIYHYLGAEENCHGFISAALISDPIGGSTRMTSMVYVALKTQVIYPSLGVQALRPTTIFFMLECPFQFLQCEGEMEESAT